MSAFSILVIDDSKYVGRLLQIKFQKFGWDVYLLQDATKAFNTIKRRRPELILMDVMMPGIDGLSLCRLIRTSDSEFSSVPVIVHTGRNTRSDVLEALRAGANNYIVKPASMATVLRKINVVMQQFGKSVLSGSEVEEVSRSIFRPDMTGEERLAAILKVAEDVKAMPQAVQRTLQVTNDKTSGAKELAMVIASDMAISTMVLKRANSSYYGTAETILDSKEAIVRIGFLETKNLVLGLSIIKNFKQDRKNLGFSRLSFWEHSLAVGTFAKQLAIKTKACDASYAFVGGLLHDIGKIVVDEYASNDFDKALELVKSNGTGVGLAEREAFGLTHNEIGQSLLEQWKFPKELQKVVMYHNGVSEAEAVVPQDEQPVIKLVALANALAKALRIGHAGDDCLEVISNELAEFGGLGDGIDMKMVAVAREEINSFKEFIGLKPDGGVESLHALKNLPNDICYVADNEKSISLYSLYLENSGYQLTHRSLEDANNSFADQELGVLVWDLASDRDVSNLVTHINNIPAYIPIILLADKKAAADWNDLPTRPNVIAIARPIGGYNLLKHVLDLQHTMMAEVPDDVKSRYLADHQQEDDEPAKN